MNREPVCFFCAVMYQNPMQFDNALKAMKKKWGAVHIISPEYSFSEITPYYHKEMGEGLNKKIVIFEELRQIEGLYKTKVEANQIEAAFADSGNRTVNLDPGYLTEAKLILFSTKNFFHRLYLGEGIFGELTLYYQSKKGYSALDWSYPDYQKPEIIDFFNQVRIWFRKKLGRGRK